jgi:type I restriction enzyme S subunit
MQENNSKGMVKQSTNLLSSGWATCILSDFCDLEMGQSPNSSTYNSQGVGIPFYQGKSEFGAVYPKPEKYCSQPNKIALPGDTLISVRAPVGPTNLCPHKACIGRGLAAIRPLDEVKPKFVLHLFRNLEKKIAGKGTGTTFQAITKDVLVNLRLHVPPIAEQQRIVDKIEELFSDLDSGIDSLKTAQQQLKVYRQAVLKWAFEGKLTAQWREEQQRQGKLESADTLLAQIKAEREQRYQGRYQEPLLPEADLLPDLPKGWHLVTLDQLSILITSGSRGWAQYYAEEGDYFIRAQDINTDRLELSQVAHVNLPKAVEGRRTSVNTGDLLITITGANVTKSALVNIKLSKTAYVNQHVGLVRLTERVNHKFIYYWIVSPQNGRSQLIESAYGAGKPGLNLTNLKEVIIALPPLAEQDQVIEEIESRLSICDRIEADIETNLKKAEALRQSILKQAFEGKLVPQDPSDEPASVLLERIRTEREQMNLAEKESKRAKVNRETANDLMSN